VIGQLSNNALKLTAHGRGHDSLWSAAADMERPLSTAVMRVVVRFVVVAYSADCDRWFRDRDQ
jgi:hypothetical protein